MRSLEEVTKAEIRDLLSARPVLLIGSAISQFSPTDLPAGGQLASKLLDVLLPWPSWVRKDATQLPFEAILECYPRQSELVNLIVALYGRGTKGNYLHECVAERLRSGILTAVITTNYDLAMDDYLPVDEVANICTERHYKAWERSGRTQPVFFKIHGSARSEHAETLVFTLGHEGLLRGWKHDLLQTILSGRDLIVMGYSGRDFELCPQIARLSFRRIYWLQPKSNGGRIHLSANAKGLLGETGTLLTGTIEKATALLLDRPEKTLERSVSDVEVRELFAQETFEEWRLRLLDRLACASLGLQFARDLGASNPCLKVFYCRMLGHSGKYRQAAEQWATLLKQKNLPFQTYVEYAIETAGAWFVYGDRQKSETVLRQAEEGLATLSADELKGDERLSKLRGNILRVRLTWLRREAQYAWRNSTLDSLRQQAVPLYKEAVECLHHGSLDDLCMVQDNAELIGVPLDDRLLGASEAGYRSLGLKGLELVRQRNRIETRRGHLEFGERRSVLSALNTVERYGWHHEGWKWHWICLYRFRPFDLETWKRFLIHFFSTEYPLRVRIGRLFWWRFRRTLRAVLQGTGANANRRHPGLMS